MRSNQLERTFLPIVDGPCPDADFCIKMGGCMSNCTQGPGPKFPDDEEFCASPEPALELELAVGGLAHTLEEPTITGANELV